MGLNSQSTDLRDPRFPVIRRRKDYCLRPASVSTADKKGKYTYKKLIRGDSLTVKF